MNDWQKEFPNLYTLYKTPLTYLSNVSINIDRLVRKFVLYGTLVLMAWIFYFKTNLYLQTRDLSKMSDYFSNPDQGMQVWMEYKDFFISVLIINIFTGVLATIISIVRKDFPKVVKIGLSWWGLILFVIFSYALTEFVSKIVVWFIIP